MASVAVRASTMGPRRLGYLDLRSGKLDGLDTYYLDLGRLNEPRFWRAKARLRNSIPELCAPCWCCCSKVPHVSVPFNPFIECSSGNCLAWTRHVPVWQQSSPTALARLASRSVPDCAMIGDYHHAPVPRHASTSSIATSACKALR